MKQFLFSSFTKTINHVLSLDPESTARLHKLQGKSFVVELLPLGMLVECAFTDLAINIQSIDDSSHASAVIHGTPLQLMGVMLDKSNRQQFFADEVKLTGSAEFAQQVTDLFDRLDIDWEEQLSQFIGDVPAHQTGRLVRSVSSWLRGTQKTLVKNIDEFVHEEAKWLPAREALNDFFHDIDALRMDTDRIEARMRQLEAQLVTDEGNQ